MAADVAVVPFVEVPTEAPDPFIPGQEAAVKLAELGGFISRLLGDLCQENLLVGNRPSCLHLFKLLLVLLLGNLSGVSPNREAAFRMFPATLPAVVHAGLQRPARGGAVDPSIIVIELHAFRRQPIDMWCLDQLLPIAAQHAGAKIIGEDQDYIGAGCRNAYHRNT